MITDVTENTAYRDLAERVLRSACHAVSIDVASVRFGHVDDADRSWLCFVVDPDSEDLVAAATASSAVDHFELENPNGILRAAGSKVNVTITNVGVSSEASLKVRGEGGEPRLISPWAAESDDGARQVRLPADGRVARALRRRPSGRSASL